MEPPTKKERYSFFDNEQFEKFYQDCYKKVSEEVEAQTYPTSDEEDYPMRFPAKRKFEVEQSHTKQKNLVGPSTSTQRPDKISEVTTPDEDYPMSAPVKIKLDVSTRTIEEMTGEDEQQNIPGPSTSTQRPDKASEVTTPDEDYPMSAPVKIKLDVSTRSIEEMTGEDEQQNIPGPSTSTQRPDKASEVTTPDEDYPMSAPVKIKLDLSTRTIEEMTGEDKQQNIPGPSTSTQRPDKASEVTTPDEDYPMSAPVKIKLNVTTRTIEEMTKEDKKQNFAGPSTSTQRPDEAPFTPICSKQTIDLPQTTEQDEDDQYQTVDIKKFINILANQCEIIFAEEGTFVPSRDLNDTVLRFMKPNNFWSEMHIGPPRSNSKFHFYLVVQDPLPATGTTNNPLAGKSNVMVAIRQAVLRKDGCVHIKNLARLTASQYISAACLDSEIHSISWENTTANDPIACEVMCVDNLPFNPFTRNGRIKSEEFWKEDTTSFPDTTTTCEPPTEETTTNDHELQVPIGDLKTLPSTPLAEKMLFDTAVDNRHEDKPDILVVSKFVYAIPRIPHNQRNKYEADSRSYVESTKESGYTVSEAVSEPEEDTKFQLRDPLRRPFSEYGNSFADHQIVEIPIETYFELKTSSETECDDSNLRKLAEVAQERS